MHYGLLLVGLNAVSGSGPPAEGNKLSSFLSTLQNDILGNDWKQLFANKNSRAGSRNVAATNQLEHTRSPDAMDRCSEGYSWDQESRTCVTLKLHYADVPLPPRQQAGSPHAAAWSGHFLPAHLMCPSGCHAASAGSLSCDCIEESRPESVCDNEYVPESFLEASRKSSKLRKDALKHVAPRDMFPRDDDCVREIVQPPNLVCLDPEAVLEGNHCVAKVVVPAQQVCPNSAEILRGDLCIGEDVIPAKVQCPAGYELMDEFKHPRSAQEAAIAPLEFYDDDETFGRRLGAAKQATKRQAQRAGEISQKEAGTEWLHYHGHDHLRQAPNHHVCIATTTSEPLAQCPPGYRLGRGRGMMSVCIRDIFEAPLTQCPPGYSPHLDQIGMCRKGAVISPVKECSPGFHLHPHTHMHPSPSHSLLSANVGDFGQFTRRLSLKDDRDDMINQDDVTDQDSAYEPDEIVHENSVMLQGAGLKLPDHELSQSEMLAALEGGGDSSRVAETPEGWRHSRPGDAVPAFVPLNANGDMCVHITKEMPIALCRDGFDFSVSENKCIRRIVEEPRLACANPEFFFDGKYCVKKERELPQLRCPAGSQMTNGQCFSKEVIPGTFTCPKYNAFEYQRGLGKCVAIEEVAATLSCLSGTELLHGRCHDVSQLPPSLTCPVNHHLDAERKVCFRQMTSSPVYVCPSADCLLNGHVCITERITEPEATCPGDMGLQPDGLCHLLDVKPPSKICPHGFTMYMNKCVRQFQIGGTYSCPAGTIVDPHDDTKCRKLK